MMLPIVQQLLYIWGILSLLALPQKAASSGHQSSQPKLPLPYRVVYQFPNPTWLENLAVRSSGEILTTLLTSPDLYLVNPLLSASEEPTLIYSFPQAQGLLGITEVQHDEFYVIAANFSFATLSAIPGTFSIWEVDMRSFSRTGAAGVKKVTDIPEASFLNGMTTLSHQDGTVLIADSSLGVVWKLNVKTGKYAIVINIPETQPPKPPAVPLGIDGAKVKDDYLYFSNVGLENFYRIRVGNDGKAASSAENLAPGLLVDDLSLDRAGNAWLADNTVNKVSVHLVKTGEVITVEGALDQLTVAGATSTAFGKTALDRDILYVTTCGALAAPVNGTLVEGGKIVAIDTASFGYN